MKNIFKTFLIVLVVIGFTSCEESDLQIDQLYDNVDTSGSVLRILEFPADLVNSNGVGVPNYVEFTFEVQQGDGSLAPEFTEVRYYMSLFEDQDLINPTLDADGNVLGEILIQTIPAAEFDVLSEVNGFPQATVNVTTQTIVEDLFPTAVITVPTFIVSRFELEMSDGRVWTDTNAGTTLSGPYFDSPFFYKTIFIQN